MCDIHRHTDTCPYRLAHTALAQRRADKKNSPALTSSVELGYIRAKQQTVGEVTMRQKREYNELNYTDYRSTYTLKMSPFKYNSTARTQYLGLYTLQISISKRAGRPAGQLIVLQAGSTRLYFIH